MSSQKITKRLGFCSDKYLYGVFDIKVNHIKLHYRVDKAYDINKVMSKFNDLPLEERQSFSRELSNQNSNFVNKFLANLFEGSEYSVSSNFKYDEITNFREYDADDSSMLDLISSGCNKVLTPKTLGVLSNLINELPDYPILKTKIDFLRRFEVVLNVNPKSSIFLKMGTIQKSDKRKQTPYLVNAPSLKDNPSKLWCAEYNLMKF